MRLSDDDGMGCSTMRSWLAGLGAALALTACSSSGGSPAPTSAPAKTAPAVTALRVVTTTELEPRLLVLAIASPAIGATVTVRIILPKDFAARPTARWPVLYLLHGCCDDPAAWVTHSDILAFSAASDVLVVMPDGGRAGFYSDWLHGPKWETFHLVELRRILEQTYRASDVRAVAGLSMGGLGALDYAARHPGLFRAAASFSGIVNTRESPADSGNYQQIVTNDGGDPNDLWGDPQTDAAVWRAHNPYDLAPNLRGVALFVSAGNGVPGPLDAKYASSDPTEDGLGPQNERFVAHLHALQLPVTADVYGPGTHSWPYWQRELHRAWPLLMHALGVR